MTGQKIWGVSPVIFLKVKLPTGIRQVIGQKRGEGRHTAIFLKAKQTRSGKGATCHLSQDEAK
jgi:hypothetical protein